MASLSDRLDDIAKNFWLAWSTWRRDNGWYLGPENSAAHLSPFLVDYWSDLRPEHQDWFRQHAALVLHSINIVTGDAPPIVAPEPPPPPPPPEEKVEVPVDPVHRLKRASLKLRSGLLAMSEKDAARARRKLTAAMVLMKGVDDNATDRLHFALKNLDRLEKFGKEPKRSVNCAKAAQRIVNRLLKAAEAQRAAGDTAEAESDPASLPTNREGDRAA